MGKMGNYKLVLSVNRCKRELCVCIDIKWVIKPTGVCKPDQHPDGCLLEERGIFRNTNIYTSR